ncbi:transcription-repair coupling factor [Azospirillum sp. RWY-5-1]|uniref:Transcription-repair-coupling factor n=1 Tax=Azospirillum oleiclasticum TaxID=2735135 RepID=A0ABX2T474_9PROT|nr:transcription-repair coupling factor [Azospirillum oleiclasticum]NYZ11965.1 transcription-repair coupling factor [Azospirillum oleiclasticum]NYZ19125.1 transcription-repair coupling factor [Azospirillum oleiclasticum]
MITIDLQPGRASRLLIGGAPEGHDARILAELAKKAGAAGLLHVALDDARVARLEEALAFFAPGLEVVTFPAWDCLPYDRVSPNGGIVANRIDALTRLLARGSGAGPVVVLTTVNALVQKVPPRSAFRNASFTAKLRDRIDLEALQRFLANNGYTRAQTVREPGEFAVRGGIVDLFPPGAEEPLRLDLFGDELEGVRAFDPMSQRTTEKRDGVTLKPMSEVFLDEPSIARFRSGYRELFGAVLADDPLYEAVSAGRKHAGMEHWLPLFHDGMDSLLDYMPKSIVSLDHQAEEARDSRLGQVAEFHDARATMVAVEKKAGNAPYKPIPPGMLFLDRANWDAALGRHAVAQLSPFAVPPGLMGQMDAGGRRGHDFAEERARPDVNVFDAVKERLRDLRADGRKVLVAGYSAGSRDRLMAVLADHGIEGLEPADSIEDTRRFDRKITGMVVLGIEHGFSARDMAVITEQDILGDRLVRPAKKKRKAANFIAEYTALNPGDLVVHMDHGIGRYDGLETLAVSGAPHDCLRLVYEGGDKLYVPVENIEVLSRYGSEDAGAQLDKLGGAGWQGRKARVKKRLKDMAEALLRIAAERELKRADPVMTPEGLYQEFAARFPYPETDDQLKAIEEVFTDLGSGKPMDRLVCGDVGFGKTEVALRAAFLVAMGGQQVAVVVPTTLLARQHFRTFQQRFAGLPVRIVQLSRMVSTKDQTLGKKELADGTADIVVGTHALLSKTIGFKRLGMVIVDEEQHFGVKQKERLKELRADVHVLTLTATPIPRTLQMALAGVRELSVIATPPVDRLAVRTFVLPYDPVVIREAILREHYRGGQSFYVCPRVEDLPKVAERLRELVPEVKVVSAHGQMGSGELEDVMTAFDEKKYDVLLATNIIESGLDIPSANTLVVHRADLFGLAQLYQIRGRVGRSKVRGYAYLTYASNKPLSATATQRLHVIETLDNLGAGFQLASHDMDIRGAGNLLGEEQSGHVKEVGVELYQHMLEEAVANARAGLNGAVPGGGEEEWTPQINLGTPVLIPESYVTDLNVRLTLYRRIAELVDRAEIDAFAAELIDRFGKLPAEVENLLDVVTIKQLCRQAGIERVDAGPKGAVLTFHGNVFARPDRLVAYIAQQAGTVKLRPDHKLVYTRVWDDAPIRVAGAKRLMRDLAQMATGDGPVPKADVPPPPPPPPPAPVAAKRPPFGKGGFTRGRPVSRR